tara:strand:- start:861 stop:1034 length:174 start_codon:yes stop_codon:yes gene_type:complete
MVPDPSDETFNLMHELNLGLLPMDVLEIIIGVPMLRVRHGVICNSFYSLDSFFFVKH